MVRLMVKAFSAAWGTASLVFPIMAVGAKDHKAALGTPVSRP
jgi:hypothetical protein